MPKAGAWAFVRRAVKKLAGMALTISGAAGFFNKPQSPVALWDWLNSVDRPELSGDSVWPGLLLVVGLALLIGDPRPHLRYVKAVNMRLANSEHGEVVEGQPVATASAGSIHPVVSRLRDWLWDAGRGAEPWGAPDAPALRTRQPNGQLAVGVRVSESGGVKVLSVMEINRRHYDALAALPDMEYGRLLQDLKIELSRFSTLAWSGIEKPLIAPQVESDISPASLDADTFYARVNDVTRALVLISQLVRRAVGETEA